MTTTRVTSPFGFEYHSAEVIAGVDLHDRRALVTGAASGIGVETARALASAGAETVIAAAASPQRSGSPPTSGPRPGTRPSRWRGSTCSTAVPSTGSPSTSQPAAHPGQQRRGDGRPRCAAPGRT